MSVAFIGQALVLYNLWNAQLCYTNVIFSFYSKAQHSSHHFCNDNNGIVATTMLSSHECRFIESKSPSLIHLPRHQNQPLPHQRRRQIKSEVSDASMHFSPLPKLSPSKYCVSNADFVNIELSRQQSLVGE